MLMIVVSAALVSAATVSPTAQDPAGPLPAPAKAKKVCRQVVPTGSIMPRAMCLTPAEWSQFQAINSKRVEQVTNEKFSSFDRRLSQ
jgi:hypothetical protein